MNRLRNARGQFASAGGNGRISSDISQLINNALLSRRELLSRLTDPRKDIDDECGYPRTDDITPQDYRDMYDRRPIATRVVQILPSQCWMTQPTVYETEDVAQETPFEEAWMNVSRQVGGTSWHEDEESNAIWEHLYRADELSGIGAYGILLLGLDDGLDLQKPVEPKPDRKLLFLRSFDQSLAKISQYENDVGNPRFGQPTEYQVNFDDPVGNVQTSKYVHWSRVIHLADNLGSSAVFGVPRMQTVFNRLSDLHKLYGGSAEMYWRGAFPGLAVESHPQLGGDIPTTPTERGEMREALEKYMNGLQRYLAVTGVSVKSLAPQVVDPSPQIEVQITAICIRINVPKRIFMGSERGELSSVQDDAAWKEVLMGRQQNYLTPRVIVPFIDRLIMIGVLPEPQSYKAVWPDLASLTAQEQADIAVKQTEAMAKYIQGSVEALMPELDYLTRILGIPTEEAEAILKNAMEGFKDLRIKEAEEGVEETVDVEEEGVEVE